MRAPQFIKGHVIFDPLYNQIYQLKTTKRSPNFQIVFHKKSPPQDFTRMTLWNRRQHRRALNDIVALTLFKGNLGGKGVPVTLNDQKWSVSR